MSKTTAIHANNATYNVIALIGEGGSGIVYSCYENNDNATHYALKISKNSDNGKKSKKDDRLTKEICFQRSANNESVVPCIASGITDDGKMFYLMPLYEKTLRNLMNEPHIYQEKLKWFLDLCEAVKYAHTKNIIHRDIKPENAMFDGTNILLGDFGIAHYENSDITTTGERLGNFNYHAPEQKLKSIKNINFGTDIYSLGLILNELFTKVLPIGINSKKVLDIYPPFGFLDAIIKTMLINNIDERENDIQNIINKINFNFERLTDNFEEWKDTVKIPETISENDSNTMLKHISEDLKLADYLINDPNTKWSKINYNYHMNFGYSANSLLDTIVLFEIFDAVKRKFDYEGCNYLEGLDSFYVPLDHKGKDKQILEDFIKIIRDLNPIKINSTGNFSEMQGICIKYFQCLCDYHAKEVMKRIDEITKNCKKQLLDAPLLWIGNFIQKYVKIIKEETSINDFKFEDWVEIIWDRCELPTVDNELYNTVFIKEELENRTAVISKLKDIYENLTLDIIDNGYYLYFTIDEWNRYQEMCKSSVDETIPERYVLNGDIISLYHYNKYEYTENHVMLHLTDYDVCNVLPKVLFLD